MDYGFSFLSFTEIADDVAYAEKKGFTHAWLYDSQMICGDPYQCLALCGDKTKKIKLGTNVTNPKSRIAPVTANSFATLNVIAPGRVIMGIGTGNTARRAMGMPAAKLNEVKEHIKICKGLFEGGRVKYQEEKRERMIQFLNPDSGWINIKDKIDVFVAASGPKALEMAGEVADGVILFGAVGDSLLEYALQHVRKGAEKSGRTMDDIYVMLSTAAHVCGPDDSLESMQEAVGAYVTSQCNIFALSASKNPEALPQDVREDIMNFKQAYRTPEASIETRHLDLYKEYVHTFQKEHAELVTEKMIKETTLTGTKDEIKNRIAELEKAGVNQLAIHAGTKDTLRAAMDDFADNVINY